MEISQVKFQRNEKSKLKREPYALFEGILVFVQVYVYILASLLQDVLSEVRGGVFASAWPLQMCDKGSPRTFAPTLRQLLADIVYMLDLQHGYRENL